MLPITDIFGNIANQNHWRGGRVDECGGFEIRCSTSATGGSNPSLSALSTLAAPPESTTEKV